MTADATKKDAKTPPHAAGPSGAQKPNGADNVRVKDRRHAGAEATHEAQEPLQGDTNEAPEPADVRDQEIAALSADLAKSEAKLSATLAQYKDALDEFNEAKARLKRDVGKEVAAGKRDILTGLLDVLDNLERALEAAAANTEANDGFFRGVSMVRDQFVQKLAALGVTRREAMGQAFDPGHFEAISTVPVVDAAQDGVVVGVVRHCYMLGEDTLRHGVVAVGKHG